MTLEEERRYLLRYEIECALTWIISKKMSSHVEAARLFKVWREDEDGDLAMDRLINLIIH